VKSTPFPLISIVTGAFADAPAPAGGVKHTICVLLITAADKLREPPTEHHIESAKKLLPLTVIRMATEDGPDEGVIASRVWSLKNVYFITSPSIGSSAELTLSEVEIEREIWPG